MSGPRGAVLGQQDGVFEAWIFPWKILSDLRIRADMENYPVPIAVNMVALLAFGLTRNNAVAALVVVALGAAGCYAMAVRPGGGRKAA